MPEDKDAARERAFNALPLPVRVDIAQARNMRARMLDKQAAYLEESRVFKAMVGRLSRTHGLSTHKIANVLGITWKRIDQILLEQKSKP